MSDLIHFAHGNGFPALCYKQLLECLETRYRCFYINQIGHNPIYPVGENWHNLVLELLASIKQQARKPVIAIGHSLGGVLSFLAAIEQPELFKAVILLDAPLIGPFKSGIVRLAKALGFIDRITPAYKTKGRRTYWQSRDELLNYLRTRDFFKTFSESCLNDYIDYGLTHQTDGYHLRFDRQIEYQIYRTIPHTIPKLSGKLVVPTALLYGNKSDVVGSSDVRYMKKYFHAQCIEIQGSHLFPMENPIQVAQEIMHTIDAII